MIGQDRLVERTLVGLLADGHILIEGVPGLAKTLLVKSIGETIQAEFSRIQFNPRLIARGLDWYPHIQPSERGIQRSEGTGFLESGAGR